MFFLWNLLIGNERATLTILLSDLNTDHTFISGETSGPPEAWGSNKSLTRERTTILGCLPTWRCYTDLREDEEA